MKRSIILLGIMVNFVSVLYFSNAKADGEYPNIKVCGWLAAQYMYNQTENVVPSSEWKFKNTEIGASVKLSNNLSGFLGIDGKYTPSLGPCFINLNYLPNTEIRIGNSRIPFGLEASQHPLTTPAIDLADVSTAIGFKFDMGAQATYKHKYIIGRIAYLNGNKNPTSYKDDNNAKNICGKLVITPKEGLGIGSSYYIGKLDTNELATNRYGIEIEYKKTPFWIRGEYLGAKSELTPGNKVASTGYYVSVAYRVHPQIEAIVGYDTYDCNVDTKDNEKANTIIGLNYYLTPKGWNRIILNYKIRSDKANETLGNLFMLQVQMAF